MGNVERPIDIYPHESSIIFKIHLWEWLIITPGYPSVAHYYIYPSEGIDRQINGCFHLRFIPYVGWDD